MVLRCVTLATRPVADHEQSWVCLRLTTSISLVADAACIACTASAFSWGCLFALKCLVHCHEHLLSLCLTLQKQKTPNSLMDPSRNRKMLKKEAFELPHLRNLVQILGDQVHFPLAIVDSLVHSFLQPIDNLVRYLLSTSIMGARDCLEASRCSELAQTNAAHSMHSVRKPRRSSLSRCRRERARCLPARQARTAIASAAPASPALRRRQGALDDEDRRRLPRGTCGMLYQPRKAWQHGNLTSLRSHP